MRKGAAGFTELGLLGEWLRNVVRRLRLAIIDIDEREMVGIGLIERGANLIGCDGEAQITKLEAAESEVPLCLLFRALFAVGVKLRDVGRVLSAA